MLAMLHRNLPLLATLASAFLLLSPQAAHASDVPTTVTLGSCFSDDKCSAHEAPITADPSKNVPFVATCKSFRSSMSSGRVCATTSCSQCQDLSKGACLKAGTAGYGVFAQYCGIGYNPPMEIKEEKREIVTPQVARAAPPAAKTLIGSCYTDNKCSVGATPITLDTSQRKDLGVKCKSFYAKVQKGGICESHNCVGCQDLTTVNPCMKSGTTFLSYCEIAVNPPLEKVAARKGVADAL